MVYNQSGRSYRAIELKTQVLTFIDRIILDIENEITKHRKGIAADGTIGQLERIHQEIEKMKLILDPKMFYPSYPLFIVDSWDFKSVLGNDLLYLAEKYKELNN